MLIDTHCHLNDPAVKPDMDRILSDARQAGVRYIQTISTKTSDFVPNIEICQKYPGIFCSIGIHPLELQHAENILTKKQIVEYCKSPQVTGIGETGLDFHYADSASFSTQISSFKMHIEAAQETGLPLIIHSRDAEQETIDVLQASYNHKPFKAVLHCFTGSYEFASKCLDLGFYTSASGIVTFKNAVEIRESFLKIPHNRILIETDTPYLAPVPYRGKMNEPAYLKNTAVFLADLLGYSFDEFARITTENAMELFGFTS